MFLSKQWRKSFPPCLFLTLQYRFSSCLLLAPYILSSHVSQEVSECMITASAFLWVQQTDEQAWREIRTTRAASSSLACTQQSGTLSEQTIEDGLYFSFSPQSPSSVDAGQAHVAPLLTTVLLEFLHAFETSRLAPPWVQSGDRYALAIVRGRSLSVACGRCTCLPLQGEERW